MVSVRLSYGGKCGATAALRKAERLAEAMKLVSDAEQAAVAAGRAQQRARTKTQADRLEARAATIKRTLKRKAEEIEQKSQQLQQEVKRIQSISISEYDKGKKRLQGVASQKRGIDIAFEQGMCCTGLPGLPGVTGCGGQRFTSECRYEIDHIEPWCVGKNDDRKNLQALCHACHKKKTSFERKMLKLY